MRSPASAPDPFILRDMNIDQTILPSWKSTDGHLPVDPRLVAGESTAVIVGFGQSNISNYAQTAFTPVNPKVHVLNILNGGIYQVGSPPLPGTGGIMDNVLKRIADKMIGRYSRVIIVPAAISSTAMADWAVGGAMNHRIRVAAARIASKGLTATHVLWSQGESDNAFGTSQASCFNSLQSAVATIRDTELGNVNVYMALQSYYLGATAANVRAAQAAMVGGNVLAGPDLDTLGAAFRYDNIHWNATGSDSAASLWNAKLL